MYKFDFDYFANVLGASESSNNYDAENGFAYGRYQFTAATFRRILSNLGEGDVSVSEFLTNHELQEKAYRGFVNEIINYVVDTGLTMYLGTKITGKSNNIQTEINLYGLVAGAWLGGKAGLRDYLSTGNDKSDIYGTYISDYIAKFSEDWNKKKE
jgi:hypothetical protein